MLDSYLLIVVSFLFLFFGYYKNDYTTLMFSSISFIFTGLSIMLSIKVLGALFICYGIYIGIRTGIELIAREGNEIWQKRKSRKNHTN